MADAQNALKFTRELGHEICVRVTSVGFEAIAAERVGVHRNTVRNWRERGEAGEELFADFARELATAKAAFMERELERVGDARWVLERMDPHLFSAAQKHELTGRDGRPLEHAHKHEHTLSRDQSLEIVSKVLGVGRQLVEGKFKGRALSEGEEDEQEDEP